MSQDRQAQFDAVKALLKQNQFDKARMILQELGGPKAERWLAEIDAKHPPQKAKPTPALSTPKKPAPLPPSLQLDEMDEIRTAIREKRYEDANALLVLSDHPEAEKLRERLAQIRGVGTPRTTTPTTAVSGFLGKSKSTDDTASLVRWVTIVVLCVVVIGMAFLVIMQLQNSNRPNVIRETLATVCRDVARLTSPNLPSDRLTLACNQEAAGLYDTSPQVAEYCYDTTKKEDTIGWVYCLTENDANFPGTYLESEIQ